MLGTFRLILALLVALSHVDFRVVGLNPGVIAVVCFYLISGYVMAGLIQRHYPLSAAAPAFYLDRALRLLPQYTFYLVLTFGWQTLHPLQTPFLAVPPVAGDIFNNLLIVPLNYYMFNGSDRYTLIPPAWSLGAEIQFYLVAPFLLLWPKRMYVVGVFSLGIYLAALGGFIHSEWFGYRLLPGVLLFFLLGAYLRQCHCHRQHARAALSSLLLVIAVGLTSSVLFTQGSLRHAYNLETLLGLAIGTVLLQALARLARTDWDELAGNISYGVFLNHFLVLWTIFPQGVTPWQYPGFLVICITLAWLTQRYIEQPLLKARQKFRRKAP